MCSVPDRPEFSVDVRSEGDRTTVAVTGEIDVATADEVRRIVAEQLPRVPVRLDLAEVTFMDSSGIRMLDSLLKESSREGAALEIGRRLQQSVLQILELTGMMSVLPFAANEPGGER